MESGQIEKQRTVPSALLSPYKKGYSGKTIAKIIESVSYTASYKDISIQNRVEVTQDENYYNEINKKFENLTNDKSLVVLASSNPQSELVINTAVITGITFAYRITGQILLIVGLVLYLVLVVNMIKDIRNKKYDTIELFIISSGVLGLLFTLIAGIAYNDVATAYSIKVLYLCGAYPLVAVFSILSIFYGFPYFLKKRNESKEKAKIIQFPR
jgi:uncharacterized protein with PQ loop repeat